LSMKFLKAALSILICRLTQRFKTGQEFLICIPIAVM
jgi:hypothetical protein